MGDKKDFKEKDIFTTYDAARICSANIASIKNWIAKGLLRAFRTPGGHYRIKRRDLELFVQKYNMPYPFAAKPQKRIYVLDSAAATGKLVAKLAPGHSVTSFKDTLEAVLSIGIDRPDILVFEYGAKGTEGQRVLELLQGSPDTRNIQLVVYTRGLSQSKTMELRKRWNIEEILDKRDGEAALAEGLGNLL